MHEKSFITSGPGIEFIKTFSRLTQLSMKFQLFIKGKMVHNKDFSWFNIVTVFILLINVKMPTIV